MFPERHSAERSDHRSQRKRPKLDDLDPATSTGAFVGTGESAYEFGAISQGFIHEPGLVFTSDKVVLSSTVPAQEPAIVTTVALNGTQVDGCALLGG
jgi:hypothetical protein